MYALDVRPRFLRSPPLLEPMRQSETRLFPLYPAQKAMHTKGLQDDRIREVQGDNSLVRDTTGYRGTITGMAQEMLSGSRHKRPGSRGEQI